MATQTTAKDGKTDVTRSRRPARNAKPAAVVPHLSVAERVARGKAARKEVPRAGHGLFEPLSTR